MPIPSSNISMTAINTEVTSVDSLSLKTLSDNATSGSDPNDGAPYGMSELVVIHTLFHTQLLHQVLFSLQVLVVLV